MKGLIPRASRATALCLGMCHALPYAVLVPAASRSTAACLYSLSSSVLSRCVLRCVRQQHRVCVSFRFCTVTDNIQEIPKRHIAYRPNHESDTHTETESETNHHPCRRLASRSVSRVTSSASRHVTTLYCTVRLGTRTVLIRLTAGGGFAARSDTGVVCPLCVDWDSRRRAIDESSAVCC